MATNNASNEHTSASGTVLQGQGVGTTSAYSTTTYPATNAVNTLLYASSANVMSALATANSGVLITSSGGVPSISSTLPSAVQGNITSVGNLGNQLNTSRCLFSYKNASVNSNVTGDGTDYVLVFGTSLANQGSNFDGVSTFTAPATGMYTFTLMVLGLGLIAASTPTISIKISGTSANTFDAGNNAGAFVGNNFYTMSIIAPMTAADTCQAHFIVSGGTKAVSVYGAGSTDNRTCFSGFLFC